MKSDIKYSMSSHSEPSRRYHNLLYIPFESGYESSSGLSASSSTTLSPIEYIIYPIGLRKVLWWLLFFSCDWTIFYLIIKNKNKIFFSFS